MFYFFLIIIFLILFPIILLGLRIVQFVLRIFAPFRKVYSGENREKEESHFMGKKSAKSDKKKIFSTNDGEYVDYEEV